MIHIYRITYIGGFWRLMRDDKLHSTYRTQASAKDAMASQQRLDETGTHTPPAYTMNELLRHLWNKAVDTPGYNEREWFEFEQRFNALYARAYAARKGE